MAEADQEEVERKRKEAEEHDRLMNLAGPLLRDPGVLHRAIHAIEDIGVVGERKNIGLLRLAVRSRALKRPVNIEVNSPSSTGKTFVVLGALSSGGPQCLLRADSRIRKSPDLSRRASQ